MFDNLREEMQPMEEKNESTGCADASNLIDALKKAIEPYINKDTVDKD